ncbi:MAG TPA: hypothetical protein GXZ98_06905 [Firmicutes bacterium]|nr:hypothetical protein [Bacillota bacterium]
MPTSDRGLDSGAKDQIDLLLEKLHRLQRPGEFTPLAAACGWVEKEVPPGLLEEIMARIHREEKRRRSRALCLTGGIICLFHVFIFVAVGRILNPMGAVEQIPSLVGCFWLLASLWFCVLLLTGFLLSYGGRKEVEANEVTSTSVRLDPAVLSRKGC